MDSTLKFELTRANELIRQAPLSGEALTIQGSFRDGKFHVDVTTGKLVAYFDVISHGIDAEQYFQGCGSGSYDDVATGIGDSFAEAFDDALDQLAMGSNFDVSDIEELFLQESGAECLADIRSDDVHAECHTPDTCNAEDCEECEDHEECQLHYYVSIRVKG